MELFNSVGDVEYHCAIDFVDYFSKKRVKCEPDSINNIVIDSVQN